MAGAGVGSPGQLWSAYTQPAPPPAAAGPAPAPAGPTINAPLTMSGGSSDYNTAYQQALSVNQQNYNNITAGYQQTATYQQGAQAGITAGYNTLNAQVMGGIAGTDQANQQAINDMYAQQIGQQTQSMVDRGLGNTTVTQAVQRGLTLDQAKAQTDQANKFAYTYADYQSQLGQAGLGYQNQAVQQNVGLANQQLQFMNSVSAPYPDPSQYSQAAYQSGQAKAGAPSYQYPTSGGVSGTSSKVQSPAPPMSGGGGGYYGSGSAPYGGYSANYSYAGQSAYAEPETIYPASAAAGNDFGYGGGGQTAEPPLYGGQSEDPFAAGYEEDTWY